MSSSTYAAAFKKAFDMGTNGVEASKLAGIINASGVSEKTLYAAYGDMMHLLRKYDVAPLRVAMMRCLPLCAARHTSLGVAVIIGTANIICVTGKHHSKNAPLSW